MTHCNNHKPHSRTGKIMSLAAMLVTLFCSATAGAQGIKIHQLGLGDGDCALIEIIDYKPNTQVPTLDTAVILIDAQRNSTTAASEIYKFINGRLGASGLNRKVIDYVILSHVHIDHYGNMIDVLKELLGNGYEVSYVFDRLAFNVSSINWNLDDVDECYDEVVTGTLSASASEYHQYIQANFDGYNFPISAGLELLENRFLNARMLCVAAYGAALSAGHTDPQFFIPWNNRVQAFKPKSENDLSFAFLLSYGGFRYFTGGDLGGQNHGGYANGEVPVAQYLQAKAGKAFHFCAFKVSHHGSAESTSAEFLTLVNPTLAVIPAALRHYGRSVKPLPTCVVLSNLSKVVSHLAFTFIPKGDKKDLDNYCKYQNLQQTQDVTVAVNFADLKDAITMHIGLQARDGDYAVTGTPSVTDITCSKTHAKGPFSTTTMLTKVQAGPVIMVADSAGVEDEDSVHGLRVLLPVQRDQQEKEQKAQQGFKIPQKQLPAINRKKKKQHNH